MKLIGFTGPMGSGKSTAIEHIRNATNTPVNNIKFAKPLYDLQEAIYNRVSSVYRRPADFVKDRKLLQWLGTEWGRGLDEDLWRKLWAAEVEHCYNHVPNGWIVCDDVRFDNEASLVKYMGGHVIRLECNRNLDRITTGNGITKHPSELGIAAEYVDYHINNDGTIEEFKTKLSEVFKQIAGAEACNEQHK